jgi:cytochrome c-type biogenesis protein CcmH
VRRALALAALALSLAASAGASTALAAAPRTSLSDVENEVMCVTCRIPLNVADSPQADEERAFIRERIARGQTKAQIEDALVAQYGRRVLATPDDHGIDLAAWLVPGVLVVAILGALAFALPRWRRNRIRSEQAPSSVPALDPADTARLDDELARFDA